VRREGHGCKDYAYSDRNLYSMRSVIWSSITEFRSSNNRSGYDSLTARENVWSNSSEKQVSVE